MILLSENSLLWKQHAGNRPPFLPLQILGNILRAKGRKPIGYQILLVVAWFGAEFMAGVTWGVVQVLNGNNDPEFGMGMYLIAMLSAALAGGCVFLMVKMLPSLLPTEDQFVNRPPGTR